jgi:hypothetical protein
VLRVEAAGRSFRPFFEGLGVEAFGDLAERSLRQWRPGQITIFLQRSVRVVRRRTASAL